MNDLDYWEQMANSADEGDRSKALKFFMDECFRGKHKVSEPRAIIKKFSEIPQIKPDWLWPGHLPRGMFCIIGGDPGQGKSAVGLDVAARISAGRSFISSTDTSEPGDILIAAGEDVPEITISPRLLAMGANMERVFYLYGREGADNKEIPWNVNDVGTLKDAIKQIKDSGGELKLFIIDPLEYFLGGDVDVYRNNEVRGALRGIMELAKEENITICAVQHFNKTTGTSSIYRVAGSIAFAAAARCLWIVTKDKDVPGGFLFANSKMSIAKKAPTYRYTIEDIGGIGIPAWSGTVDMDAEGAINGNSAKSSGKTREQEKILEIIRSKYPQAIKFGEIKDLSGKADGHLGNILKSLEKLGEIEKPASLRGHYIWIKPEDGQNSDIPSSSSDTPIGKKEEEEEELDLF